MRDELASEASVNAARDAIAEEVWRLLQLAHRLSPAAIGAALLFSSGAILRRGPESYNRGVRTCWM